MSRLPGTMHLPDDVGEIDWLDDEHPVRKVNSEQRVIDGKVYHVVPFPRTAGFTRTGRTLKKTKRERALLRSGPK